MRRIFAGVIVILLALVGPPAEAQTGGPLWTSESAEALESDGEVVLTLSLHWGRPARVSYQTVDGTARAFEDYTAVSGEVVFTDASPKTIRIPIIDDDLAERTYETFTVDTWEEPRQNPEPSRDSVIVRIVDDESGNTGEEEPSGSAVGALTPNTASGAGVTVDPATPKTATRPSRNLRVALPADELRPGPGFELTSERPPEPALERGGGGGSAWWLASWLGLAAVGIGALAFVRRRRRWSPTQA